jgi:hypothetical protein
MTDCLARRSVSNSCRAHKAFSVTDLQRPGLQAFSAGLQPSASGLASCLDHQNGFRNRNGCYTLKAAQRQQVAITRNDGIGLARECRSNDMIVVFVARHGARRFQWRHADRQFAVERDGRPPCQYDLQHLPPRDQ